MPDAGYRNRISTRPDDPPNNSRQLTRHSGPRGRRRAGQRGNPGIRTSHTPLLNTRVATNPGRGTTPVPAKYRFDPFWVNKVWMEEEQMARKWIVEGLPKVNQLPGWPIRRGGEQALPPFFPSRLQDRSTYGPGCGRR